MLFVLLVRPKSETAGRRRGDLKDPLEVLRRLGGREERVGAENVPVQVVDEGVEQVHGR